MFKMRKSFGLGLAAAITFACIEVSQAETYPSRPITMVVATEAGGTTDMVARLIGEKFQKRLGQPVIVENRPGAGNVIGTSYVAKAKPDGYTLLMGSSSPLTVNPAIYATLPYDAQRDFQPISLLAFGRIVIVANASLPVTNLKEMISYSKAHPGETTYATPGNGTTQHLIGEMLKSETGLDMRMVPYRGSGPALTDVLGGRVSFMVDNLNTSLPQVRAGGLHAIAVTSADRVETAPDIPTVAESGAPGFAVNSWIGLVGPIGMPRDIVDTLFQSLAEILHEPDVKEKLATAGLDIDGGSPEKLSQQIRSEIVRYREIIKKANIQIQ
jgi:tripartite-type tricarboxylate transporter receptor subunit TctC